jgi:hypothetical protein
MERGISEFELRITETTRTLLRAVFGIPEDFALKLIRFATRRPLFSEIPTGVIPDGKAG